MKTIWALGLTLIAAMFGCSESPQPSESYILDGKDIQRFSPGPEFQLSREAARQKREAERPLEEEVVAADVAPPTTETSPEEPRRRTVFDSLYEAVRNGAAAALDENAGSP